VIVSDWYCNNLSRLFKKNIFGNWHLITVQISWPSPYSVCRGAFSYYKLAAGCLGEKRRIITFFCFYLRKHFYGHLITRLLMMRTTANYLIGYHCRPEIIRLHVPPEETSFFFFAKRERALLITHETCYSLLQSTTQCHTAECDVHFASCASSWAISFCSLLTYWNLTSASI
jgi:hypothetical protein